MFSTILTQIVNKISCNFCLRDIRLRLKIRWHRRTSIGSKHSLAPVGCIRVETPLDLIINIGVAISWGMLHLILKLQLVAMTRKRYIISVYWNETKKSAMNRHVSCLLCALIGFYWIRETTWKSKSRAANRIWKSLKVIQILVRWDV